MFSHQTVLPMFYFQFSSAKIRPSENMHLFFESIVILVLKYPLLVLVPFRSLWITYVGFKYTPLLTRPQGKDLQLSTTLHVNSHSTQAFYNKYDVT